jgi:hypothetical protein
MPRERSYRKVPIHPTSDDVCWSEKFGGTQKENQSLFTLLIEIESRLRAETRYEKVDQLKRSRKRERQCWRVSNLSRYCE